MNGKLQGDPPGPWVMWPARTQVRTWEHLLRAPSLRFPGRLPSGHPAILNLPLTNPPPRPGFARFFLPETLITPHARPNPFHVPFVLLRGSNDGSIGVFFFDSEKYSLPEVSLFQALISMRSSCSPVKIIKTVSIKPRTLSLSQSTVI